jgi:hypothetical protein
MICPKCKAIGADEVVLFTSVEIRCYACEFSETMRRGMPDSVYTGVDYGLDSDTVIYLSREVCMRLEKLLQGKND